VLRQTGASEESWRKKQVSAWLTDHTWSYAQQLTTPGTRPTASHVLLLLLLPLDGCRQIGAPCVVTDCMRRAVSDVFSAEYRTIPTRDKTPLRQKPRL